MEDRPHTKILARRSPAALARRFAQICNAILAESLEPDGLAPLHYAVLGHLAGGSEFPQNELAMSLGVDRTNIGVIITQLETRGLVARRVDRHDRRVRLVRTTAPGERLYARLSRSAPARRQLMLAPLTAMERERFIDLLLRIVRHNESYAVPGTGGRKPRGRRVLARRQ